MRGYHKSCRKNDEAIPEAKEHLEWFISLIEDEKQEIEIFGESPEPNELFWMQFLIHEEKPVLYGCSTSWIIFNSFNELKVEESFYGGEFHYENKHIYLQCLLSDKVSIKRRKAAIEFMQRKENKAIDIGDII